MAGKPIAIYGAGTGLGVAHLVHTGEQWLSLPGEGGHVDFAANSEEEDAVLQVMRAELGHVSAERLLSGPGLVNIYRGLVKSDGREPQAFEPKDITERALAGECLDCRRTLSLFCVLMGRFAGNLALNMGTFGGVYIAGGIVPRFQEFFIGSGFRVAFEDKGRFKSYLKDIPSSSSPTRGRVCSAPAPICASRSASSYKLAACRGRIGHGSALIQ